MLQAISELDHYRAEFERVAAAHDPVERLRSRAIRRFQELGFPTTKQERWRFTNPAPIAQVPFRMAARTAVSDQARQAALEFRLDDAACLVFLNGHYCRELSDLSPLPPGVRLHALESALLAGADLVLSHVELQPGEEHNPFPVMNTAFFQDAAVLHVSAQTRVPAPLQLLFLADPEDEFAMVHPRTLIVLDGGSAASVVETFVSVSGTRHFTNAVTEVWLAENSMLEHSRLLRENSRAFHVAGTAVHQMRDSRYASYVVTAGAALSRSELNVELRGEGSETSLHGLYLANGAQHVDHHTTIDHAAPHTTSREVYKGILDGSSRAVFNGSILVHKNAMQTDARQTNRNLLLSDMAAVNTTPALQILADDVKCSHGATVGQLDRDALFYFRSRGVGEELARRMLMYGFAAEILEPVKAAELRQYLNFTVLRWLSAGAPLPQLDILKEVAP